MSTGGLPGLLQIHNMEAGQPPTSQKCVCTDVWGRSGYERWALLTINMDYSRLILKC